MRLLCLFALFITLTACGPTDSALGELPDNEEAPVVAETSTPAPGTEPTATSTGDLPYNLVPLSDLQRVEGCTCLLYPEDRSFDDGLLLAIGLGGGEGTVAELNVAGQHVILPQISETSISNSTKTTYLHANDRYEVTAALTEERQLAPELREMSGTVSIKELASGRTVRVRVLGECGC